MAGGVLVELGYFLSGFVKKMEMMYLTFTVAGFSLKYMAFLGRLEYFGAITSNTCVAGAVYRQPPSLMKDKKRKRFPWNGYISIEVDTEKPKKESEKNKNQDCCCNEVDFKFRLLKYPLFTMYIVAFTIITFGHVNNSILIPSQIKALGYDKTFVATGVSITGGVEIIARILFGWFTDLKIHVVQTKYLLVISVFIGAVFAFIAPLFKSFTYMAIYAVVVSAFPASYLSLIPVLTIETVGVENLPAGYGLVCFGMAAACTLNLPIAGWMEDYFGDWHAAFILTGSMFMLAGVIVLFEPLIARCGKTLRRSCNDLPDDEPSPSAQPKQREQIKEEVVSSVCQDQEKDGKTSLAFSNENAIAAYFSLLGREENDKGNKYEGLGIEIKRL